MRFSVRITCNVPPTHWMFVFGFVSIKYTSSYHVGITITKWCARKYIYRYVLIRKYLPVFTDVQFVTRIRILFPDKTMMADKNLNLEY